MILYKVNQDNRKTSLYPGKWYGRKITFGNADTNSLAVQIEKMCTCSKSDVKSVLDALVSVMKKEMNSSNKVHVDGLGTFYLGMKTKPAKSATDFNVAKNVAGYRVNFLPEYTMLAGKGGHKIESITAGSRAMRAPYNTTRKVKDTPVTNTVTPTKS